MWELIRMSKNISNEEWDLFSLIPEDTINTFKEDISVSNKKEIYPNRVEDRECLVSINDDVLVIQACDPSPESIHYVESFLKSKGRVFDIKKVINPVDTKRMYNVYVCILKNDEIGIFYDTELSVIG